MKNITIRAKLILLFILIKIIPLLIIVYIAYEGVKRLETYLNDSTRYLFNQNKEIILNTANASIEDSIKYLDQKSQLSLERLSHEIANNVADFLYERDHDLIYLTNSTINQNNLEYFYKTIPGLLEVSIGHALVCDALYMGLEETIKAYLSCLSKT